jgi:hypothetical protein
MRHSISFAAMRVVGFLFVIALSSASAQFIDNFDGVLKLDPTGADGWTFRTGDGLATMNLRSTEGRAVITVDATRDRRGIWWAFIRRRVSREMDLGLLRNPHTALRIEARIRVSDAPRRVNLHLNTQRTTDFHSHLMEFDIADTAAWHTISMTARGFPAVRGDTVYGQLALMDWGLGRYRVEVDYFRVDVVKADSAGPDKGDPLPYHPPLPDPESFAYHIPVAHDAMIDAEYPDMSFNNWSAGGGTTRTPLLAVGGTQVAVLRWDFGSLAGSKAVRSGLLELTTYELERSPDSAKDFGMVRVSEIIGGDPVWRQEQVTYNSLCKGHDITTVINSQMIMDVDVAGQRGGRTLATISRPVLQRMLDGRTRGIAVRPLGAVHASFYAVENQAGRFCAKLHFTTMEGMNHETPH